MEGTIIVYNFATLADYLCVRWCRFCPSLQCTLGSETKPPVYFEDGTDPNKCNCQDGGAPTTYTSATLRAIVDGDKLTSATLTLTGGTDPQLTYKFPTPINGNSVTKVKFKLQETTITITQGGGNTVKATLTTTASKTGVQVDTLKGTDVDLNISTGTLDSNPTLNLNGKAITSTTNNKLKNGDTIKLTGSIGADTKIEAEGQITITDASGRPSDESLTLSGSANPTVTLEGGLTSSADLTLQLTNGQITGTVNLAEVKYDPEEFHDKHQNKNCCYYGKVWKWEFHTNKDHKTWWY